MTLSQDRKFRAQTPYIKKAAYNVVMYSPKMAKDSIVAVKKMFEKATPAEKQQLVLMMQMAGSIATANSKDKRRYTRKEREKFLEVSIMYKALRRDLENMLQENKSDW